MDLYAILHKFDPLMRYSSSNLTNFSKTRAISFSPKIFELKQVVLQLHDFYGIKNTIFL